MAPDLRGSIRIMGCVGVSQAAMWFVTRIDIADPQQMNDPIMNCSSRGGAHLYADEQVFESTPTLTW